MLLHARGSAPRRRSACHHLQFVRDVGDGILASWAPIVERRRSMPVTEAQRQWQLLRRSRCGVGGLLRFEPCCHDLTCRSPPTRHGHHR